VPKKPRQAHIPASQIKRRKVRRPQNGASAATAPFTPEGDATFVAGAAPARPSETRVQRRLEQLQRSDATVRSLPGQLPTFDPGYLHRELMQIGITGGSLLALIIVLALVLR
jgi:hypothetical protein